MNNLLIALALLLPAPGLDEARWQNQQRTLRRQAEAVAHLPPEATPPITSISTSEVVIDGRTYVQTVVVTLVLKEPEPAPQPSAITAIRNAAGEAITMARAGETITLEGTGLWQEGSGLVVQLPGPGRTLTVLSQSPTRITARLPATATAYTAALQVYWRTPAGLALKAEKPGFTVLPAGEPQPPGQEPRIRGYAGEDGIPRQVFTTGEPILILGEGFGEQEGDVWIEYQAVPVLQWGENSILTGPPSHQDPWWPALVQIRLPGWEGTQWLSDWNQGPKIVGPGQEVQPTPPPYPAK